MRKFHQEKVSKKYRAEVITDEERKLLEEYKFFVKYADVWKHAIYYSRCPSYNVCDSEKYFETAYLLENFEEELYLPTKQNNGALFFEPEKDPDHPGYFKTFLQQENEFARDKIKTILPDSNISDGPADRCKEKE